MDMKKQSLKDIINILLYKYKEWNIEQIPIGANNG